MCPSYPEPIQVKCYSGHEYAERPESFVWGGAELEVNRVEREWLEPGERHFVVRSEGDRLFELCYREQGDEWSGVEITRGRDEGNP